MEQAEDQNPLHLSIKPQFSKHTSNTNCAGRPKRKNEIRFGPQPTSMVSQLLRAQKIAQENKQAENHNDHNHEENDFPTNNDEPEPTKRVKAEEIRNYKCDHASCAYTTKSSSNMIKHKRRHTSEKPYMCDQCSFRTNFINSLTVHKRIHSGELPFVCEHCSYRCNSSSNLKKHMRKHSGIT